MRLNRAGLHAWRIRTAHALAWRRRRRLAKALPDGLREQFERDGFVVVPDVLVPAEFDSLRAALFETAFESRSQQQGDTITRRIAVGPEVRSKIPALSALLESGLWRSLMAYVATRRSAPLYYIQTIFGGVASGPSDPQLELHSDTFHPSLKAWLFLTDVGEKGRPLTYVAGSHRLTEGRLE
ncbi:MAG TPA: phytanoyl-CoA dioxygenase family protein [Sphingomicrobium sp.]|nr:phytanoyl-CoA dioxygenase family protein [Sphingomicrobium sp.]